MIPEHARLEAVLKDLRGKPHPASPIWNMRHTVILERLVSERRRDDAIAQTIAAETGDRFAERTVAEHRRQLGYRACRV